MNAARVLILDDDSALTELLEETLLLLGYSPTCCQDPHEALLLLDRQRFDLIISDFRMPGLSGSEFYHAVSKRHPHLARRIVFLTGDTLNEETQTFLRSTGNPYLAKPFRLTAVERVLGDAVRDTLVTPA